MTKNKFPRIEMRLLLALTVFVIFISIDSVLYILDIRKMNYLTQDILDHPFTVSNSVRDIEININAIHRTMKDVALANNEMLLNEAIEDVNKQEIIIYEKFEILEDRFLGDLNTVYNAKQCFKNWKPIRDEVIDLVKKRRLYEAAEITKGKGAIHVKLLFTKTHEMIAFANNKAKEFNNNSMKIMKNAKNNLLMFFLATIVIGIIIFGWLFKSISKPLYQFINRIVITTKNQIAYELPKNTNNKLVILDFAISELENREKILEEEISVRTNELQEARNLLENAIENASIGMTMVSFDGLLLDVNQAFCKFIGYSKQELLKMKFIDFTSEKDKKRSLDYVEKVKDGDAVNEVFEKSYVHKSGKVIHGSVTSTIVMDSSNNPIYIFSQIKDITKQKKHALELIEHKKGLQELVEIRTKELGDKANKLMKSQKALTYLLEDVNESQGKMKILNQQIKATNKELEAFTYSVSHDLKAPLRAVTGFSQIINEDYGPVLPQEVKRYLGLIYDNAENMGVLINDLLSFSRLGRKALHIVEVDVNNIVLRVENELKAEIQDRNLTFKIGTMPTIHADESLMYHVMVNLITNAVQFTSKTENAEVEVGCENKNMENIYYVRDNGVGFDMKYVDKIFDVFHRLHSSDEFPGTGIGLSIVQRIIYKHNGRIWVQSEKNKGTTFYFTI